MRNFVILHGWRSNPEKWEAVGKLILSKKTRVFRLDLPGFKSELEELWNLDNYVEWLRIWLVDHKIKKAIFLAHSFGARIAIKFSIKHPSSVEKLILVDAAGIQDKRISAKIKRFAFRLIAKLGKLILPKLGDKNLFRKAIYFLAGEKDYFRVEGNLKKTMSLIVNEDLEPVLKKIQAPTLIIWGEKDKLTPLWMGRIMELKTQNSKLKILKEVGHNPHLECPEKLAVEINNWLR